jgi:hypothetical protein
MEQRETYRNTLRYALAIAGSEQALAFRLRVPIAVLKVWLHGIEPVPAPVFLDAVDIIVVATPADIARSRDAVQHLERPTR